MSTINQSSNSFPYIPPSIRCDPIIEVGTLHFHSHTITSPIKIFKDEEADHRFGIVNIKIRGEIPITTKHIHMFFTIDSSGSMSEICYDGRTKMDHIKHTLENMLRIFYENAKCNISVHVQSFDNSVKPIIQNITNIHDSELEILINLVNKIYAEGSTNIELALGVAKTEINNYHILNPDHEVVHIFLTDGDITNGSKNIDLLKELVPQNCPNIFIGYGIDHDSELLAHLSSNKGNEYRFIDALENAGLIYGEVIHGILYKALEDVTLTATNGEIYDFQTNTWNSTLQIGNLLSEQMKTYHVRSTRIDECNISVIGKTIIQTRELQTIHNYETQLDISRTPSIIDTTDLGIYLFRQRTQELLYESRIISQNYRKHISSFNFRFSRTIGEITDSFNNEEIDTISEQKSRIKEKLNQFLKDMINYMKEKDIETDPIMKMLCDDIYIAYKTMGTSLGNMYMCARQTSNGQQHTYVCSATNTQNIFDNSITSIFPGISRVQRQTNAPTVSFSSQTQVFDMQPFDNCDTDLDIYTPSQDILSPFLNSGALTLMREVSGNRTIGLADNDISSQKTDIL